MLHRSRTVTTAVAVTLTAVLSLTAVATVGVVLVRAGLVNPFATTQRERPHSVVLAELRDAHRYVAATGRYTTVVDVADEANHLPSVLKGERALLIAEGDVDASVDFEALADSGITQGPDGKVTVHLPAPRVGDVRIDHERTYVADRQRGLLDRVADAVTDGDPVDDQPLYRRADEQLQAAAERSELRDRAKANTEAFVRSTLAAAGVADVTVVWDEDPAATR